MDSISIHLDLLQEWQRLGKRTLADGTTLIGHVPHIAPEAWLHEIFSSSTKDGVRAIEKDLARVVPGCFSELLDRCNGLNMFSTTLSIYGVRKGVGRKGDEVWQPFDILTPNTVERPKDAKKSFFFFGGYNWDGPKLYIDDKTQRIFRCSRSSARPLNKWDNFSEMLLARI
jgi:hypothetical protein